MKKCLRKLRPSNFCRLMVQTQSAVSRKTRVDGATTPIRRSRRGERAPKYGNGSIGKAFASWVGADEGGPKEEEGKMYREGLETLGPVSSISTASIRV